MRKRKLHIFETSVPENNDVKYIWDLMQNEQFILVSGKAGTGKSHLLTRLKSFLDNTHLKTIIVAPTAVAALQVHGITIYNWLGLGLAKESLSNIIDKLKKNYYKKTIRNIISTDVLLIDEISMLDPELFEKIAWICACVHKLKCPFGNLKIIFFGDFLQLAPITNYRRKFVFQTQLWKLLNVQRFMLRHVYRQQDHNFVKILNLIRVGKINSSVLKHLKRRFITPPENLPFTRLCSYRNSVDSFNIQKLRSLHGEEKQYHASITISGQKRDTKIEQEDMYAIDKICTSLDKHFPIPQVLRLKQGAQIMCRTNSLMTNHNICNGSIGIIQLLEENSIIVTFENSITVTLYPMEFTNTVGKNCKVIFKQFPCTLAWAISIHKSQGVTLTRALVDTNCFEYGQLYVGMSRVKSLDGLYLSGTYKNLLQIITNPEACKFEKDPVKIMFLMAIRYCKQSALGKVLKNIDCTDICELIWSFI